MTDHHERRSRLFSEERQDTLRCRMVEGRQVMDLQRIFKLPSHTRPGLPRAGGVAAQDDLRDPPQLDQSSTDSRRIPTAAGVEGASMIGQRADLPITLGMTKYDQTQHQPFVSDSPCSPLTNPISILIHPIFTPFRIGAEHNDLSVVVQIVSLKTMAILLQEWRGKCV